MFFRRKLAAIFLIAAVPLIGAAPALAHAKLVKSDPEPNSTVAAPKTIKLIFSEKVAPTFSGITVSMSDGMNVSVKAKVNDDGKTITGTPTSPFIAGKYKLSWHAVAAGDGHRTEGSYGFTVK